MLLRLISVCCLIVLCLSSNEEIHCNFTVIYLNGSRSWCYDEECSLNHLDIYSIEDQQCQTNYISFKYSSSSKYLQFLFSKISRQSLSSYFSSSRPHLERLLQIEFLSPLENAYLFDNSHLSLLTDSTSSSNIDTYELIFNGKISEENSTISFDQDQFLSVEQVYIDTLRLQFNCTNDERVEWELIKSISSFPPSPCPKQIDFLKKIPSSIDGNSCHLILFVSNISPKIHFKELLV